MRIPSRPGRLRNLVRTTTLRLAGGMAAILLASGFLAAHTDGHWGSKGQNAHDPIVGNGARLIQEGQTTFRSDTFGDETFWGGVLQLHRAIEGERFGGIGKGVSPRTALAVGLKVDIDALPQRIVSALQNNAVNLDDPATTLELLRHNAVVGVTGFFNGDGSLKSLGIQCAFCHSTVDNSTTYGVGHRLDGFANRDLNVGAIINLSPDLSPVVALLRAADPGITEKTVRDVLNSWGPGKFDAELFLDGKAFNPQQVTNGVVTGQNVSGATLIPNIFDLAGYNQHTWTGGWGSIPYWNAIVATVEMHGIGNFYDPRLDDKSKYPVAAAAGFGHITVPEENDRVTKKLPGLHIFQLALPSPKPQPGTHFNAEAAERGAELFSGRAKCNSCHIRPLLTEPGWNVHTAEEMKIDSFQADRSPAGVYKTMNLSGLYIRENGLFMDPNHKGRYYHDGRFATLADLVGSYNSRFGLSLSDTEIRDLVEYLKSL